MSEPEQREAEPRRSQELFKQVFESSHDAIFIFDPEADEFIDVNSAASEMLGYTHDEFLHSVGPSDLHSDELGKFYAFVDQVSEDGSGWTDELTCQSKNGERIPAEISASAIEIDDRQCALAIVRDITERKENERFQRRLYEITADPDRSFDEKLHAVIELGCGRFDVEHGGIARIDPATDRFEIEVITGDHDHLVPDKRYPLSETYCQLVVDGGDTAVVTDPVNKGFTEKLCYEQFGVQVYLGTHLEFDGDVDRTFFFISNEPREETFSEADRTFHHLMGQWVQYELEHQQRERELRERTEHLRALVETTPECIKTVAEDGTLLQMNPAGLDMVEAPAESAVTDECVYDLIAPEHRERFRAFNERVCQGERGTLEFDIIGLEGTRRHMETHAAPLHRPDGTTAHVALTRDITDQVEREQHLEETVEKLEESNERLESFASMLAHELRNPVTIGQIYSQQLPTETDSEPVEYVTEAFDRIEAMIDVMLVLTQGREAVGERTSVELGDVAREAWEDVNATDASLDIVIDYAIQADETYVRHLFRNLLENAVNHGGADVTVTVGELPTGFYVADDGAGIPAAERDAVFDQGYTTTADNGGIGLGLAFVQKLAEVYEWEYAVTESAAGGARFEFTNVGRGRQRN